MAAPKEIKIDMPPLIHIEPSSKDTSTKNTNPGGTGFFGEHKILIICCTIVVIITIIIICVYYWGKRDISSPNIPFNRKSQQQQLQQQNEEEKLKKENDEEISKLRNIQRIKQQQQQQPKNSEKTVKFDESSDKKDNLDTSKPGDRTPIEQQSLISIDSSLESHQDKEIAGKSN